MSRVPWKITGIRDPEEEAKASQWIEQVIGEPFPPVPYEDALKDGIILCKLMNKLCPGVIKRVYTSGGDYKFMDNIQQFLSACDLYGVPALDLFEAPDLYEKKNIPFVTKAIYAIARTSYKHPEFRGPYLGPKPSDENVRNFSEEQLRAGDGVIGLQAGTNKKASQSGQSWGKSRGILLGK